MGVATSTLAPYLDEDRDLLRGALADAGISFDVQTWDDPSVEWASYDHVLVRSTWDYPQKYDAFLAWVGSCTRTANPAAVLKWNTDKRYLDDLARAGVPTIPNTFLPPGADPDARWDDVVIKPTVSCGAADTGRFDHVGSDGALGLIGSLHAEDRTAMVQPYIDGIDAAGETSMIYLGREFSHAVRRQPLLNRNGVRRPTTVAEVLATVRPVDPTPAQRDVAAAALAAVPGGAEQLSYARVDLVPGEDGPLLLELEATDCFLFLAHSDRVARQRLVAFAMQGRAA